MDLGEGAASTRDLRELLVGYRSQRKRRLEVPSVVELEGFRGEAARDLGAAAHDQAAVLGLKDEEYPARLRSIDDPPLILFIKGDPSCLQGGNPIAVVGTRTPTGYGLGKGFAIGSYLAQKGLVVVSGLARGCDTAAHRGCLKGRGRTVAVLPSGFKAIYPEENRDLAEEIRLNRGCLVSEYPPGEKPQKHYFIERDRIQSGLCDGVLVIETMVEDGTMHTVGFALSQGRKLAALGHPPDLASHPAARGNQKLISEGVALPIGNERDLERFLQAAGSR
ncbi:MAG: DNA-protecting protein DprA [Firmicutes bacterium]|nr:DNA-protecting protein DprA [Bacillota bacterium]